MKPRSSAFFKISLSITRTWSQDYFSPTERGCRSRKKGWLPEDWLEEDLSIKVKEVTGFLSLYCIKKGGEEEA